MIIVLVALAVVMVMATGANELANQPEHSTVQSTHLHMPNMSISSASISLLSFLSTYTYSGESHNSAIYRFCFLFWYFIFWVWVCFGSFEVGDFFRFNTF